MYFSMKRNESGKPGYNRKLWVDGAAREKGESQKSFSGLATLSEQCMNKNRKGMET